MSDPNLVTTYNFNGREYLIKMHVNNTVLELVVTDKQTGEDWQCCYEAAYVENITQKTGNYKQFSIFTTMLKSGLLKTSNCVYLDLMTFEDLDSLRNHRVRGPLSSYHFAQSNNNRRYMILTYTVEFDRIHYPLPLEYCGPPDPKILQQTINKLEAEIVQLKQQNKGQNKQNSSRTSIALQKRVEDLTEENHQLKAENVKLCQIADNKSKNKSYVYMLQEAIKNLEKSVASERKSHHQLVDKLRKDKLVLSRELDRLRHTESSLLKQLKYLATPRWIAHHRLSLRISNNLIRRTSAQSRSSSPRPGNIEYSDKYVRSSKSRYYRGGSGDSRSPSPKLYNQPNHETNNRGRNRQRSVRTKLKPEKIHSDSDTSYKRESPTIRTLQSKNPSHVRIQIPHRSDSASSGSSVSSRSKTKRNVTNNVSNEQEPSEASRPETLIFGKLNEAFESLQREVNTLQQQSKRVTPVTSRSFIPLENKVTMLKDLLDNVQNHL